MKNVEESKPAEPPAASLLLNLLQKLTPKVLAVLLAFSFLLLAFVTLFVSTQGGVVDLKNMVFKGHSDEVDQRKIAQH